MHCPTVEGGELRLFEEGVEATRSPETARDAYPAYRQMGIDFERGGQFIEAAIAYSNASIAARELGRLQDALTDGQKAVEMAERSKNARTLGMTLTRLGRVHLILGAPHKAIPLFEQALRYARESRIPDLEMVIHSEFAHAYRRIGKLDLALESAKQAVESSTAAIQIGTIARHRSKSERRSVPARLEGAHARALESLARTFLNLRQWENARPPFTEALEVASRIQVPQLIAQAHRGLGVVAAHLDDSQAAVTHLMEAMRINASPAFVADAQATLGRVYRRMGKLPEAEASLRQAVAGIEDLRSVLQTEELRETYFENKVDVYEDLILTLLGRRQMAEAFDIGERARARAFLDLLGNRVTLSRGQNQSLIAEERALRGRIDALKALPEDAPALHRELELARDTYQAFLQRVRKLDREQASLMSVEPLTLREVQALLPEGSLLLEYFVTGQGRTVLWIVDRQRVDVTVLPVGRQEVARRVHAFRDAIASRDRHAETRKMAQALFDLFVRPGWRDATPRELLIVPHDALHYLPFQALMPAADRFLIQDLPLYYYSSASLMQFTREKAAARQPSPLAVGNPDLGDPALNLRYAEREARVVGDLFPGAAVLMRHKATKAKSREQSAERTILHFAMHADLEEADPLGSALRFTPERDDDGRLEVQEIFGMNLQASLVVLSACETALGTLSRGDELTGLTRAFLYAGTPSIITTLWRVNDRASYELMQEFYRNLQAGRGKAEALRQAQIATLMKYPDPYYWAAYELTGEAR
jgi:CHAT domain-containing protein/tetratricopeptide (TPR) repeat protein